MMRFSSAHAKYPKESPWKRRRDEVFAHREGYWILKKNHFGEEFDAQKYVNMDIDIQTKNAALKHSTAVVSLVCLIDGEQKFIASGTIVESFKTCDRYLSVILTTASFVTLSDHMKIDVHVFGGRVCEGSISACDLHYNIALIHIRTNEELQVAPLRLIDDSISINPEENHRSNMLQSRTHSNLIPLSPGDRVIALSRHYYTKGLMIAPGVLSLDRCGFDCKELTRASCKIGKGGIGGPLINSDGEVIGFNFYHESFTPFLAVNIVCKCLEHFKMHGRFCRPWLGMELTNLFAAKVYLLEHVIQKFPNTYTGVIVEKVIPGSHAHNVGLLQDDIIVGCDGSSVLGFLDFFSKVWEKTNKEPINLLVIREGQSVLLKKDMLVEEAKPNNFNSWPLPEESRVHVKRTRNDD